MLTALNYLPTYSQMRTSTGYGKIERGLYYGLCVQTKLPIVLMGNIHVSAYEVNNEAKLLSKRATLGEVSFITGRAFFARDVHPLPLTDVMLYSMNESTKLTRQEVTLINAHIGCVLVPARQMVAYYELSGVKRPVYFVGGAVDLYLRSEWPDRLARRESDPDRPFTWLTVSYGDFRKGADLTIQAFVSLYARDPRHRLIIKARDDAEKSWLAALDIPGISVYGGLRSHVEWNRLLAEADAFVFPSRGEGYGLPPREAVVAGLPTIATNWLGMSDVKHWGWPLGFDMINIPVGNDMNADDAMWAQPRLEDLKASMVDIYENYEDALKRAAAGREYLLMTDNFMGMASKVLSIAARHEEWKR